MQKYDFIIAGAGLFGSTVAYELSKAGMKVLVIDKRHHIGGNCFSEKIGKIDIHRYGPHIFHTGDKEVWDWINQFGEFEEGELHIFANYKDAIYSLPFNMQTFTQIWPGTTTPSKAMKIIEHQRSQLSGKPANLEEQAISLVGVDIYEKLIKGYTEKQWGRSCAELPPEIIARLPVRMTYDNRYFNDRWCGVPENGYTQMFERMLAGCDVHLGEELELDGIEKAEAPVIFTGPIDKFFNYSLGQLEYRSLEFKTEMLHGIDSFQGCPIMNYPDKDVPWTRIVEHKHFKKKCPPGFTVITREYPKSYCDGAEPYYPVNDAKNNQLYSRYCEEAKKLDGKVIFGGRLGMYKYMDMDDTITAALDLSKRLLENEHIH